MSSNCLNKQTILNDPNCKSPYVDAVNAYISQMNKYCLEDNHSIQDSNCIDFINNYEYIYKTQLQQNLLNKAINECQKNTDTSLNDICINKFKYIPPIQPIKPIQSAQSAQSTPSAQSAPSSPSTKSAPSIQSTPSTPSTPSSPSKNIDNTNNPSTSSTNTDLFGLSTNEWIYIVSAIFIVIGIVIGVIIFKSRKKKNIDNMDLIKPKVSTSPIIV
jgi:hypothetical protein